MIRPERGDDYEHIARVVGTAFATEPAVVELVELLRASPGNVPELALVAEDDGDVVGQVMFTESRVEGADATILILSPLAVRPERQRQRVGSAPCPRRPARRRRVVYPPPFDSVT